MRIHDLTFHRLFSLSMYKTLKLPLGKMTFTKDFINDTRGDLYPVLSKSRDCNELLQDNYYHVKNGTVERMLGQFFPYATYELSFSLQHGSVGLTFYLHDIKAKISYDGTKLIFQDTNTFAEIPIDNQLHRLVVSCRPCAFDLYSVVNDVCYFITTFASNDFSNSHQYHVFSDGYVSVSCTGNIIINEASFYVDCGISQADIRPIRYENGDIMVESGKVYLTASLRMQKEMYQGVFSWIPGTQKFELVGAIFYDSGDGKWCGDVAASLLYNRKVRQWYLWVCSFNHDHILGHAVMDGDPRFGLNVIDIDLMEKEIDNQDFRKFIGYPGDEDPDFFFDEEHDRWLMAICRTNPSTRSYQYVFFESQKPFSDYSFIGCGKEGAETGGSFVRINNRIHFICGNSFSSKSDYRIYDYEGLHNAKFDFPDGGFRGWGSLIPVKQGTRTRYYWLTFDRHNGSTYNWSYGNVYCFEAIV